MVLGIRLDRIHRLVDVYEILFQFSLLAVLIPVAIATVGVTGTLSAMSGSFLENLIRNINWKYVGNLRTVVFFDDGFSEMFKWHNEPLHLDFPILPLIFDKRSRGMLSLVSHGES